MLLAAILNCPRGCPVGLRALHFCKQPFEPDAGYADEGSEEAEALLRPKPFSLAEFVFPDRLFLRKN
jgi:hypothetical protein